jgi:hypothetical protein
MLCVVEYPAEIGSFVIARDPVRSLAPSHVHMFTVYIYCKNSHGCVKLTMLTCESKQLGTRESFLATWHRVVPASTESVPRPASVRVNSVRVTWEESTRHDARR